MWTGRPVIEEVAARFEITFQIALMATLIGCFIAIPLGTMAALYRGTWVDTAIRMFAVAGLAVPSFWLGMLIILAHALEHRHPAAADLHADLQGSRPPISGS